jgi:alpha/beta superfamily hydrolase
MREKTDRTGGMAISVHFVGKNALPAAALGKPRGRSIPRAQPLRIFAPLATLIFAATAFAQDKSMAAAAKPPEVQSSQLSAARLVDLKAPDGTILKASYFAAARPGPGVLLLHQGNRTRHSWDDLAEQLTAAGINTLTLDMRGYGESGGKHQNWPREDTPVKQIWADDIDAAWKYLTSQQGVNGDVIGLGGAGFLGVDNSILTACRHSTAVKALVLLSGETLLRGQQFLRQESQLPGLFVVADEDEDPPTEEVMEWIHGISSSPDKRLVHYAGKKAPWKGFEDTGANAGGSHGTDLFKTHPELPGIIVD